MTTLPASFAAAKAARATDFPLADPPMALTLSSRHLSDSEFLVAFKSALLPTAHFHHADHLRLAWLIVHRMPLAESEAWIRTAISHYAATHGLSGLYHETVSLAWVRLVATHHEATFDEFLHVHQARLRFNLLHEFWSAALLASPAAKQRWVEPDLRPLPS